ncbi:heme exporter protein CcmD [Parendozoicomonas haliclonae]|uniref:Heme exporter protein D n=1 Tax=Parendozoicomonas haliclonae TaxID=1960125 RepID=A0A1X7AH42_9GAMM|nr:heme exporter protein CcmD [Parendozoicomonas haliclonae]SMA41916.1 Heme exporter protein D (CcmD) [Parendozoicomonas haliclonae]
MYFEDLNALISMDGHGPYVWACYGLGMIVLAWNLLTPLRQNRAVAADIQRRARRERVQQSKQ